MWQYYNPVKIAFTNEFIDELIKALDINQKILFFCSKRFTRTDQFIEINDAIKDLDVYTEIENNPSFNSCNEAIIYSQKICPDQILAVGGGSVIDTAKAVRLSLISGRERVEDMLDQKLSYLKNINFVVIPTTHGTASELTKWATVWNKKEKKKYSLSDDNNYANYAIYDYHFVESLPIDVSIISTLDALSHSFEALWNKNANPISDLFAIKAIKIILENIDKIEKNTTIRTRVNLLKANVYSGLAFSNTKTAAAHSISYPLTSLFDVPHGIACSITLENLFWKNMPLIKNKVDVLMETLEFKNFQDVWNFVKKVVSRHIKFSLKEYGINENDLDKIVLHSSYKDRMGNNIAAFSPEDIKEILIKVF